MAGRKAVSSRLKAVRKQEGKMIAQLSVYPIGETTSLSRFVKKGVSVIEKSGYTYEVGGMATTIETPGLDELQPRLKKVHSG